MNVVYFISRKWSADILIKTIKSKKLLNLKFKIYTTHKKFIDQKFFKNHKIKLIKENNLKKYIQEIRKFNPTFICAFGWSEYLNKELRNIAPCLILHPSKLPKFRGGSPIQNQLIRGVKVSAITILLADKKIDSGNILFQKKISFDGYLDEIHERIVNAGVIGLDKIIHKFKKRTLITYKQNHKKASIYKRRTPLMSEILINDFKKYNAKYFYNLVRGLQKPYPECFIKCKDNSILYLQKVSLKKSQ